MVEQRELRDPLYSKINVFSLQFNVIHSLTLTTLTCIHAKCVPGEVLSHARRLRLLISERYSESQKHQASSSRYVTNVKAKRCPIRK